MRRGFRKSLPYSQKARRLRETLPYSQKARRLRKNPSPKKPGSCGKSLPLLGMVLYPCHEEPHNTSATQHVQVVCKSKDPPRLFLLLPSRTPAKLGGTWSREPPRLPTRPALPRTRLCRMGHTYMWRLSFHSQPTCNFYVIFKYGPVRRA